MKFSEKFHSIISAFSQMIYPVLFSAAFLFGTYFLINEKTNAFSGLCFWIIFLALFCLARPHSGMHGIIRDTVYHKFLIVLSVVLTILYCIVPMKLLPLWNGEDPGHRNQYELLAESFLDGKLYIEYGDEEDLLTLENPYDPDERSETGVRYHWDHAYYNGRYYVYFGVVPVLLVFLPYRLITGSSLTTYHATQIFTALFIIGFFCLTHLFSRRYFNKITLGMYLVLSAALSLISVWYASTSPALYCTAITAGLCMAIWSLYFYCKGVLDCADEKDQLRYAFIGAVFGALTFGCRPPIGLSGILVLPLLFLFLKQRPISRKLLGKLCLIVLPYIIVAAGLMAYNHARFDNVFEFGQSYQLTVADQRELSEDITLIRIFNATVQNFFYFFSIKEEFPHITHSGVFFNFPILLFVFCGIIPEVWKKVKQNRLNVFLLTLIAAMVIITIADVIGSPFLMERYRMDIYFLVGILCYLMIGFWHSTDAALSTKRSSKVMYVCVFSIILTNFHYFYEVSINYPEFIANLESVICFWRYL